jgi:tRNA(fMet)-specific endonuclease VapC
LPTSYLLDTNAVTALANGNHVAIGHLSRLTSADEIYTCFVVIGEWEYGILNAQGARKQAQIRAAGDAIFTTLTGIWESTRKVALQYGALYLQLRTAGQILPINDIWIAATAQSYGATVVTSDPHFRRISGLSVVDWTQP